MLINSPKFFVFFILVFAVYWLAGRKSFRIQNVLLLICSYFFYACWDWRFVFLLLFSTLLDFYTGYKIHQSENVKAKKAWLAISVCINLGFLGFFKYSNFFLSSFNHFFSVFGYHNNFVLLNVVLPVGISFYTFHGLSYVFDVYNGKRSPTINFVQYALFVSFFPLLIAGPIERATHLLPQFEKPRKFNYLQTVDGLRQILWGLFKKLVIADNCAKFVNDVFLNSSHYHGITLLVGTVLFSFQIYCDFSGYADIALGLARLLGFDVIKNFSYPYFSRSIAEFWRRWNISLSTWFRDYLYIPLGGSKVKPLLQIRNVFIVFLLSGLWHGANWTFVIWGTLNALYILPSVIFKTNRRHLDIAASGKIFPGLKEFGQILATFTLVSFSWIFFRSNNLAAALNYIQRLFVFQGPFFASNAFPIILSVFIPFFIILEWIGREDNFSLEKFALNWRPVARWIFYGLLVFSIGMYKDAHTTPFIYFQF